MNNPLDFSVVDVETANEFYGSICQIGLVLVRNGKITETWETLVDPQESFSNTWLHGISAETVHGAPTFPQIVDEFLVIAGSVPLIHHTHFDRIALQQAGDKYGLKLDLPFLVDSARLARYADPKYMFKGYGLENLCNDFGILLENRHNALGDALLTAKVVFKLLENTGTSITDWLNFDSLRKKRRKFTPNNRFRIDGDPSGPLHGYSVVFTGELSRSRKEAANQASAAGVCVRETVNKDIDYLVVGFPSHIHWKDHKLSAKQVAANQLIAQGQKIKILSEEEFNMLLEDAEVLGV